MIKIKNIISTKFNNVKLFEVTSHSDPRGSFREIFNDEVQSLVGDEISFIQLQKYVQCGTWVSPFK